MLFTGFDDDTHQVFRIRPRLVPDRRDSYRDYNTPESRTEVPDAIVQPVQGTESATGNREAVLAQYSITDTESGRGFWLDTDHAEINGVQYQIVGHVQETPSPTGDLAHTIMLVNRWEG